jgi:Co/Zn/Cd efflux system component
MSFRELKANYSRKKHGISHRSEEYKLMAKYYPGRHEPHDNFLYAFLCLVYEGEDKIDRIKKRMRPLFIAATNQVLVTDEDVEEYFLIAKKEQLIRVISDDSIELTEEGKRLVKVSYYHNLYTSHYMRIFFSEKTAMGATALFLIILSILKILTGLQLGSQAMLTEGFENLTDLIKIGIIVILSFKFKKDKFASIIIIGMMMFTGFSLIWSGIESLLDPSPITPTIQAYIIGIVSIVLNFGLLFLKSMVGRISGNLSLLSDSKDASFNIRISIGVLIGLTFAIFNIYFVDALIGIIIAILVFIDGITIIRELVVKEEDFDITSIKVYADNLYNTRLSAYIIGSIRREDLTLEELLSNFGKGLSAGRLYYEGFADFFYANLDINVAKTHLEQLIKGKYIEEREETLYLTQKGLKAFYKAKEKEFRQRAQNIAQGPSITLKFVSCIVFIICFILLIVFAPQINLWLSSF